MFCIKFKFTNNHKTERRVQQNIGLNLFIAFYSKQKIFNELSRVPAVLYMYLTII